MRSRTSFPSSSVRGLGGHGRRQGYGQDKYPGIRIAEQIFESRSERSKAQDLVKVAQIAPNLEIWLASPNRFDIEGVDSPDAKLIFSHKSKMSQAVDLAKLAKKRVPMEIWVQDTSQYDLEGIDTPKGKHDATKRYKTIQRFKIQKKSLILKKPKKPEGRKLPTTEEIVKKATETFQEEQVKKGLPSITPEVSELKEAGLITEARDDLMRTESKVSSAVEQYIHDLDSELREQGYTIVPL